MKLPFSLKGFSNPFSGLFLRVRDSFGSAGEHLNGSATWIKASAHKLEWFSGIGAVAAIVVLFFGYVAYTDGFVPTTAPSVVKQNQPGATLAIAFRDSIQDELDHGWIPNDIFYPTVLLWNYKNFQFGELDVWLRISYQFREHLSRVRTSDSIDKNLDAVDAALHNKPEKFWFPSYESQLREAVKGLDAYVEALPQKQDFSERADNLAELIANLASTMGSTQNQLAQALPSHFKVPSAEKEGDSGGVGFWQSSVIFYQAKGKAYATLILMQAIRVEFENVLVKKNAVALVDDSIFWLKEAVRLRPMIVLNSDRDGFFANHLDNFAAPFGQTRAKINSLVDVLHNG